MESMWARSRLSSVALLFAALATHAQGDSSKTWSIEKDRSNEKKHGLFEIQQAAKSFVSSQNAVKGMVVGEPDLRIWVPRCATPLKPRWKANAPNQLKIVAVRCSKAIENPGGTEWTVDVPVYKSVSGKPSASSPRS